MSWNLAYRNLYRNKRRTFSTAMAICIGFVGLNLLGAYIYRVKKFLDVQGVYADQLGHVSIFKKDATQFYEIKPKNYTINQDEQDTIQKQINEILKDEIDFIGKSLSTSALLSDGVRSHPVYFFGLDPLAYQKGLLNTEYQKWTDDPLLSEKLKKSDWLVRHPDTLSLTTKIGEQFGLVRPFSADVNMQLATRNFDGDLNAVNVDLGLDHSTGLEFLEDTVVRGSLQKAQELLGSNSVQSMQVYFKTDNNLLKLRNQIDKLLNAAEKNYDVFLYSDEKINAQYQGAMGFLFVMGGFFVFLISTAVSLTIINSLTMGIIERTREVGTLRAIGFKVSHVRNMFIQESLILSSVSMLLGVVLSGVIAAIVNAAHIMFFPPGGSQEVQFLLVWNLWIAVSVFILLTTVSTVSSYVVIKSKMKMKLITLLNDSSEEATA